MIYSRIIGTGSYLPQKILTNEDLERMVDTSNEWIVERTGIERRHISSPEETTSYMAEKAAQKALDMAGKKATDLDLIVVATTTPDKTLPSTACLLQERLGLHTIPAFDVGAACAGFIYAVSVADSLIKTGTANTVLVVGAEVMSSILDWNDRTTCVLFGDGAGAVILEKSVEPGLLATHLHADGRGKDKLYAPSALPGQRDDNHPAFVRMVGKEVFRFAVKALESVVSEALENTNISKTDIDWLVPHQANLRIIAATAKALDLPMDKVILTVQDHGNTSAASIPLALDQGIRDGRIKPGHKVLCEAIGAGFAWGSALFVL